MVSVFEMGLLRVRHMIVFDHVAWCDVLHHRLELIEGYQLVLVLIRGHLGIRRGVRHVDNCT